MTLNEPHPGTAAGWIGHWAPGIGDPTPLGWVTVLLYALGAWQCWRLAAGHAPPLLPQERRLWWALALLLLALGLNKQLDLQTALTEIGRILARAQGWYAHRQVIQQEFIAGVLAAAMVLAAAGFYLARRTSIAAQCALAGSTFLLAFVVIRASSFHHVDLFIRSQWLGLSMNGVMETGGIAVIILSALWRRHTG